MSRSYRKPYSTITGVRSAADDKRVARRSHRRAQNQELRRFVANQLDWDCFLIPERYEASFNDVWSWGRDGKQRLQFPPNPPDESDFFYRWGWWYVTPEERERRAQESYERDLKWFARLQRK